MSRKTRTEITMIVNMTPHPVTILLDGDKSMTIPPVGTVVRCAVTRTLVGTLVEGVPVYRSEIGAVEGLPSYTEGVVLIVSRLVVDATPARHDVLCPDDLVRDADGQIVGCRALSR
jgi:hypothetical protein